MRPLVCTENFNRVPINVPGPRPRSPGHRVYIRPPWPDTRFISAMEDYGSMKQLSWRRRKPWTMIRLLPGAAERQYIVHKEHGSLVQQCPVIALSLTTL